MFLDNWEFCVCWIKVCTVSAPLLQCKTSPSGTASCTLFYIVKHLRQVQQVVQFPLLFYIVKHLHQEQQVVQFLLLSSSANTSIRYSKLYSFSLSPPVQILPSGTASCTVSPPLLKCKHLHHIQQVKRFLLHSSKIVQD